MALNDGIELPMLELLEEEYLHSTRRQQPYGHNLETVTVHWWLRTHTNGERHLVGRHLDGEDPPRRLRPRVEYWRALGRTRTTRTFAEPAAAVEGFLPTMYGARNALSEKTLVVAGVDAAAVGAVRHSDFEGMETHQGMPTHGTAFVFIMEVETEALRRKCCEYDGIEPESEREPQTYRRVAEIASLEIMEDGRRRPVGT